MKEGDPYRMAGVALTREVRAIRLLEWLEQDKKPQRCLGDMTQCPRLCGYGSQSYKPLKSVLVLYCCVTNSPQNLVA